MSDWPAVYRAALPDVLRPDPDDSRFLTAAWHAYRAGWAPEVTAGRVARHDYRNAFNPVLIALMRLEDVARESPEDAAPPHDPACFHGWIDPEVEQSAPALPWPRGVPNPNPPRYTTTRPCPVCRKETAARVAQLPPLGQRATADLPLEWIRERTQLLRELGRLADLTEDERQECMRVLIADQGRRPNPV